ncbi:hypothetical protein CH337_15250 [Rhodoblastus acidophilus]|nr:hypothetical protein CKO16_19575 [Rhodoblastus acidophilus]RAI17986.1 hypothetical protein CH337_15250 [Rhodoblastus acidophilus]
MSGRSGEVEQADTLSRFVASDLILPKDVDISKAAQRVREYYQVNIAMVGLERLEPAIDLLNKAIDPAISNVFQLEQSTGGVTLQEIILSIREILFKVGKDLILLVEDFAALAGIQEVLLKVCIQEGEHAGEKVRATMRTALALTDGHLNFRDTILTRARFEWVVGGRQQSDDEIRDGVVDMVGAYLNAARWGNAELKRLFKQRALEKSLTDWLPTWRDEDLSEAESDAIAAFGSASNGAPLFPLNREAIDALAGRFLLKGGKLELNPRRVINQILRSTLLLRGSFEAHEFPPTEFQSFRPNAVLAGWIRLTHQPDAVNRRLSSFLALWGGNPPDVAAIKHMPPAIFTAFHLPTPSELANINFVEIPKKPMLAPAADKTARLASDVAAPNVGATAVEDPRVVDLRLKLENWVDGTVLEQRDANELRKALMDLVRDVIDWPALRMRSVELPPNWIEIPQARGNLNTKISVADDAKDSDGSVRAGLLAAFRFVTVNSRRWSYPQADDDYVASAALVDRLIAQLQPVLLRAAQEQAAALGRALLTQSRIIGLEPAIKPTTPDSALKALFAKRETKETQAFEDNWDRLRSNASAAIGDRPGRERLQTELLARIASFQGTGRSAFAIDIVRLLDAMGDEDTAREGAEYLPEDVKFFIRPIAEARIKSQLSPVIAKLKLFSAQISDYIDASFDKAAFVSDLQDICRLILTTGIHVNLPFTIKEFERRLTEFQASAIKDLVGKVVTVIDGESDQMPKALNALGTLDLGLIDRTITFLGHANSLIRAADDSVSREEANRTQADPAMLVSEITGMLTKVAIPEAQDATP